MQPVVLEGKKKELLVETASSESEATPVLPAGGDGPSSEEVADSDSILRNKAERRAFPGTSWFDGKHFRYKYVTESTLKYEFLEVQRQIDEDWIISVHH